MRYLKHTIELFVLVIWIGSLIPVSGQDPGTGISDAKGSGAGISDARGSSSSSNSYQITTSPGEFRDTDEKAFESSLVTAQTELITYLREKYRMDVTPSLDFIRKKLVIDRIPTHKYIDEPINETLVRMSLILEVRDEHLRELRKQNRLYSATWDMGYAAAIFFVIALIICLEEWTKGFLTRTLLLGGIGLLLGLLAAWFWAR